ncbi:hypothetical protein [Methylorubrum extorquens]
MPALMRSGRWVLFGRRLAPGESPALVERLQAHGWDLSEELQDECRLLEFVHRQSAIEDFLPNGMRFPIAGVFAQHTVITAHGISARTVERLQAAQAA